MQALALAHDPDFRSDDTHVDLEELIESSAPPSDTSRISIVGRSRTELSRSLAIDTSVTIHHELITNAAKHGALSHDEGSIDIRLKSEKKPDSRSHVFAWQERGTRPNSVPARAGTGTRLIDADASQAAFSVERRFDDDGFFFRIAITPETVSRPARRKEASSAAAPGQPAAPASEAAADEACQTTE